MSASLRTFSISTVLWAGLVQATFVLRTEAVLLPVRVVDSHGRAVAGLLRENFRVYDEGRLQTITAFSSGPMPATLGLALDYSVSMRAKLSAVLEAVDAFTHTLQADDEVFALWFNDAVSASAPGQPLFARAPADALAELSRARAMGATALYDGVVEGLTRLQAGTKSRKALIVISDGGDNRSQHTLETLIASAHRANAVVYAVGLIDTPRDRRAERILQRIAAESGGAAYFAASPEEVGPLLADVARDLRDQYTLAFVPDESAGNRGVHRIKVTVSAPGAGRVKVRTRPSYEPGMDDR